MPPAYGATDEQQRQAATYRGPEAGDLGAYSVVAHNSWPEVLVAGRFGDDARNDVAVATSFDWAPADDQRLHFFEQDAQGALAHTQAIAAGETPSAITRADFNRDGLADLAVAYQDEDKLGVFLQRPGGAWAAQAKLATGDAPDGVAAGDFNGDTRPDLAVIHAVRQVISVRYQQSNGTFAAPVDIPFATAGFNVILAGDLNGDGYDDITALRGAGSHTNQVAVYIQQNHALRQPVYLTAPDRGFLAHGLAVGDVTGDGRDDIVVTAGGNSPDALVNVFPQRPDGTLNPTPASYPAFHLPEAVQIGDVNHDGRNDVVVAHAAWLSLSIYLQQSDGTLAAYARYPLPYRDDYRPNSLALADVNSDGGLDVLIANHSSLAAENGLVVLPSLHAAPVSEITTPQWGSWIIAANTTVEGTASTSGGTLEYSTNGGKTWASRPAAESWSFLWSNPSDGAYKLLTRVNSGGVFQAPPARSDVIVDRTLPAGSLVINDGAQYTNSATVALKLTASDYNGIQGMRLANAGQLFGAWEPFATERAGWVLTGPDGEALVQAQVRDVPGNVSTFSDTIVLDRVAPTGTITLGDNSGVSKTRIIPVTIDAFDATSGVNAMCIFESWQGCQTWQTFSPTFEWTLNDTTRTPQTVCMILRDRAGNESESICGITEYNPDIKTVYLPTLFRANPVPVPTCVNLVGNEGFEQNGYWNIPATVRTARYSSDQAHGGFRSLLAGIADYEANLYSYSSAMQMVAIPANAPDATLSFWLYRQSGESAGLKLADKPLEIKEAEAPEYSDLQLVIIQDQFGNELQRLVNGARNNRYWANYSFNMGVYAGREITLYFGVYNNGFGGATAMFVDDVELRVCYP